MDFKRGTFRVMGDVVDVFPASEGEEAYRIEFFGDEIDTIKRIDALTAKTNASMQELNATFSVISESANSLQALAKEMMETINYFQD